MQTKIPLLSVIIPVYNVEKYIAQCLDSLVAQSLGIEQMQIICVNDCTSDGSMDVIATYTKQIGRAHV